MSSGPQRSKRRDITLSTLDGVIQILTVAKDTCGVPPAQIALGSACVLLTTIKDTMGNKDDYVDLGLSCAEVCKVLDQGLKEIGSDKLSKTVVDAIERLKGTMTDIQGKIVERNGRSVLSRAFHAKSDKDAIAAWKQEFNKILQIFNTELHIGVIADIKGMRRDLSVIKEGVFDGQHLAQASIFLGEVPPPAPKAFFGRETLIEEVVSLAEKFEPIALIGAGGIGKTSIALTVLHHDRIKDQFGDNRRFINCDKFTPSLANFLARLSKVIGGGIENPEDLTHLRPLLSSIKMFIVFDNAEFILDPEGRDSQEILAVVAELCQFDKICVCITSRITMVPEHCKHPDIPALSMEAAREIFYGIYNDRGRSDSVDDLIQCLEFHPLSITLLAAAASHNKWDYNRLRKEWSARRVEVLRTGNNKSLAATIKLSLDSPTFLKLGPVARDLLGVIAFFPQGIYEDHLGWLFPTLPDIQSTFDKFCALSLTYRGDGHITMLAPIRDYLAPNDPTSSPLLCATKDRYFTRLSVTIYPGSPGFEEAQWIVSEDVNVEHLLNIFASIDATADSTWDTCSHFLEHLHWHKPRKSVIESKIGHLTDDHPSKPKCLFHLSQLLGQLGNFTKQKQLLIHALKLERERGNQPQIAQILKFLCCANRWLHLYGEGIERGKEALEVFEQLDDTVGQADSLNRLAVVLYRGGQPDAAEDAAFRAIGLLAETEGQEFLVCRSHRWLGDTYRSKGQKEKAIHHFETALKIGSRFEFHDQLFWTHLLLADLFREEGKIGEANTHIEQAKLHVANDVYNLGRAKDMQARIWHLEHKLEEAALEASRALEIFEKLGAAEDAENCRDFLQMLDNS